MGFTIYLPKNPLGSFCLLHCVSGIHRCCDCFHYEAFDFDFVGLSQANPLFPRFWEVMREVAFLFTVIAGVCLLFALALIDVHGCQGIWGWVAVWMFGWVALSSAESTVLVWKTPFGADLD